MAATGFHEGERSVQAHAGVTKDAARLERMLGVPNLDGGGQIFLARQRFLALTARDPDGVLWTSAIAGDAGFLRGHGQALDIAGSLGVGDPLSGALPGTSIGTIAIDFAARRRMRVNGIISRHDERGLRIEVEQAYGNCPQYIHPRQLGAVVGEAGPAYDAAELTDHQRRIIETADTFFLGTTHPDRGTDASHRGGEAGFVRIVDGRLCWPDYPGNNMFNSFGNLEVDPTASLLFCEFSTGETLHLTGTARVDWQAAREVAFTPTRVIVPPDRSIRSEP